MSVQGMICFTVIIVCMIYFISNRMPASHAVGRGFASRPGHTTIKVVHTPSLPGTQALG